MWHFGPKSVVILNVNELNTQFKDNNCQTG